MSYPSQLQRHRTLVIVFKKLEILVIGEWHKILGEQRGIDMKCIKGNFTKGLIIFVIIFFFSSYVLCFLSSWLFVAFFVIFQVECDGVAAFLLLFDLVLFLIWFPPPPHHIHAVYID